MRVIVKIVEAVGQMGVMREVDFPHQTIVERALVLESSGLMVVVVKPCLQQCQPVHRVTKS